MEVSLLVILFLHILSAECHLKLNILPFGKDVIKEPNEDLNLTCKVLAMNRRNMRFDLTWKFPTRSNANGDRITVYQKNDQLTVTIHKMQEDDTGQYVCKLQDNGIIWSKKISVFVRSKKCHDKFFDCGGGLCIAKHYVCDGYSDCPTGYDEASKICGADTCHNKILCDGRCISKDLCCDSTVDPNCTMKYIMACCAGYPNAMVKEPSPKTPTEDCYGKDLGNRNVVVYVIITFAAIIMAVSITIFVLACRACTGRTNLIERLAGASGSDVHHQYLSGIPTNRDSDSMDNIDFFFDDFNSDECPEYCQYEPDPNFALCNFIPGVGFRVVDPRPKPPPYTENAIGIPPPPYESTQDLSNLDKEQIPPENSVECNEEKQ